jgi:DNA-binding LacI/PurR family transcriptional regulator
MAHVSTATVSRVINTPEKVKPETREIVQKVINELDYRPNALARSLIQRNTKSVGILIPDINNLFYPAVVRGAEDSFENSSYSIFLCNTDKDIKKEQDYIKVLLEKRVDGMIIMGTRPIDGSENEHIRTLCKSLPVVMVNDTIVGADLYSVLTDEVEGAYNAVNYLIGLGHRKIAHVTGEIDKYTTYQNKFSGYEMAMREHKLAFPSEYVMADQPYPLGGSRAAKKLFALEERPTAIFAASDQIAMGVMKACFECSLKIPDDLSVVGYANIPISEDLYPELTTVNQFPYETGVKVAEVMMDILEGRRPSQKKIILSPELLIRKSCKNI